MADIVKKLTTFDQLKLLAQRANAADLALSNRIDEITAAGGQANVLEGVKVNGNKLTPDAEKMVDILIAAGEANGTIKVNGVEISVAGLKALAFKDKVGSDDLDETLGEAMATIPIALEGHNTRLEKLEKNEAGYQNESQVSTAIQTAISASGHAHFEKVDAVPTAETASENVLYLVMNATTQHYDIYAKVSGEVVLIDDTTVDLSNYYNKDEIDGKFAAAERGITEALSGITDKIGEIPEGATSTTVVGYVNEVLEGYTKTDDIVHATDEEIVSMLDDVFGAAAEA